MRHAPEDPPPRPPLLALAGRRILRPVVGWILIVLGIMGLVLPGLQGVLLLTMGIALVGPHHPLIRKVREWGARWLRLARPLRVPIIVVGIIVTLLAIGVGVGVYMWRTASCEPFPLLSRQLLPNAAMETTGDGSLPDGYVAGAPGVQRGYFALDGDARSLQLMGIANYVQTPPIAVRGHQPYCFTGYAITDSDKGSPTRLRVAFHWFDREHHPIGIDSTAWQPVALWQATNPPEGWSPIVAAFVAPPHAATLSIRLHPSSDDRIYLDVLRVQRGGKRYLPASSETSEQATEPPRVARWPEGKSAALAFSFDWETAMGGLVHSRSVGDPSSDADPELRGLRMREGLINTIKLFRPYGIRATYYASGYALLLGNTSRTQFMGNPTYSWATREHRWASNYWATAPWFSPDPYGTYQSHPAWYAGDLVPQLREAGHDIQSHTFSHFYGGLVREQDWLEDGQTWNTVAAAQGIPEACSLAFPWSSSGGMSDTNWEALTKLGIRSVTRLSDQSPYNLFPLNPMGVVEQPYCLPLPGHASILACPDFYLTPARVDLAIAQIEHTIAAGGVIELWAHTEEVVTEAQQAAWQRVVAYAATQPHLWIAPLREITDWQRKDSDEKKVSYPAHTR